MKRKICALLTAVMLLVPMAAACTKSEENNTKTTDPNVTRTSEEALTETAPPQETDTPAHATGTIVTEAVIKNIDGNYTVSVPDSWIGKTSYEFDGNTTVIYHITQNQDEPELNPILMNIGVLDDGEVAVGDIFMEIDGVKYYSIPRLDFPYTEGSEDALEFATLYEEIELVLQNIWLIDESAWQEAIGTPEPFTANDLYFSDIHIGDAKDDVLAKVGEPEKSYDVEMAATGEIRDINEYTFGNLVFVDGKLVTAQIVDETYSGPRGIKTGMEIDQVAARFVSEKEIEDQATAIYYRANPGDDILYAVPPSAVLYKGDMQTLSFSVFTEESGADDMTIEQLKGEYNYIYMEQYELVCEFDAQGVMLSFAVRVGAPSE